MSTSIIETCGYCGCVHSGTCPRIKSIDYYPNGSVKRVELWGSNEAPPLITLNNPFAGGETPHG